MRREVMDQSEVVNHPICGARKRQGDGVCRRPAGAGTNHVGFGRCKLHGGATPNHDLAAARARLDEIAAHLDLSDPLPHEALQFCVRAVAAQVDYCSRQIADLTPEEVVAGGRLHPWVRVRRDALDLLARVARHAICAKAQEHEQDLLERYGAAVAGAIEATLDEIGLDERQQAALPDALRRNLLLLESTKEIHDGTEHTVARSPA